MKRQICFAEAEIAGKKRVTRRQRFLAEMEKIVPWQRLLCAIEPHYPKGTRGRPPIGLERMLRIYFLQHWFQLSDPGAEEALYDSRALRNLQLPDSLHSLILSRIDGLGEAPRRQSARAGRRPLDLPRVGLGDARGRRCGAGDSGRRAEPRRLPGEPAGHRSGSAPPP